MSYKNFNKGLSIITLTWVPLWEPWNLVKHTQMRPNLKMPLGHPYVCVQVIQKTYFALGCVKLLKIHATNDPSPLYTLQTSI